MSYGQLQEYATYLSTAFARKYSLQAGDSIVLCSPNTVWYPVAMVAAGRVGTLPFLPFMFPRESRLTSKIAF
jgi:acyl-CoA synthetase (AMP-forming)/AMP-acid ligase II